VGTNNSASERLTIGERILLVLLFLTALGFGYAVELRSAFMQRRMTDLDVYLRAAWAVRTGGDIYTITDDNDWHYHYPPLFAICMTPLADPPAGADRAGMPSFAVSVAICYVLSVACLLMAVHLLAGALEHANGSRMGRRRWWHLRIVPILACLAPIGHTLMRGQVNHLLLLLLCGALAALLRQRSAAAGGWLAGAICLKVIPAFLLIYPAWRRDWRCLAGCGVGLVIFLGILPSAVFGPSRTFEYYREWDNLLRRPAMGSGTDNSRDQELHNVTATDSQSFLAIIHNSIYADRATRPPQATDDERRWHWSIAGGFTFLTLCAAGWRRRDPIGEVIFFGMLTALMVFTSPVAHLHYFALSIPLILGLQAHAQQQPRRWPFWGVWYTALLLFFVATFLPHFPGLETVRDFGLALYAGLAMWLSGCVCLFLSRAKQASSTEKTATPLQIAA
jgi:hypothetical protein